MTSTKLETLKQRNKKEILSLQSKEEDKKLVRKTKYLNALYVKKNEFFDKENAAKERRFNLLYGLTSKGKK